MSEKTPEKKEPWLNQMALATVIFAVCATLATFKGGSYSTQSMVQQGLASDQWNFYQAKSMKQHLFELQTQQLELQMKALARNNPARADYAERIQHNQSQADRYAQEKRDIQAKAETFEAQRDAAKRHTGPLSNAVLLLQITILLSSVASLMKNRSIWLAALPVGVAGLAFFANGFVGLF